MFSRKFTYDYSVCKKRDCLSEKIIRLRQARALPVVYVLTKSLGTKSVIIKMSAYD